jgi:biotin operon repressor
MFRNIFLSSLLGLFLFSGVVSAHSDEKGQVEAGLLPGNPFYFIEILSEGFGSLFTFNDLKKADRLFDLAEERLAEAEKLAQLGKSRLAKKATEKYERHLAKALKKAEKAKGKGKNTDEILAKMAESTVKHQLKLAEVHERVSDEAKEAIEHAMEESMKGHDMAIASISKEKQDEISDELDQIFEEVDSILEELRTEGIKVPKIKDRGYDDEEEEKLDDEFDDLDDELEDLDKNLDEDLEDLNDELDGDLEDLSKELDSIL